MRRKVILIGLIGVLFLGFILTGCTVQPDSSTPAPKPAEESATVNNTGDINGPVRAISAIDGLYWTGFPYQAGFPGIPGFEAYLLKEYNDWKAHYVTASGCPAGTLRVQTDYLQNSSPFRLNSYCTPSEAQAYGMLLAVYTGDVNTFNMLYNFAMAMTNRYGLMHWLVDANGQTIDEFGNVVPASGSIGPITLTNAYTGEIYTSTTVNSGPNVRWRTSAADADLDMAAALVLASYRWGSVYAPLAISMINAIMASEVFQGSAVDRRYFICNGSGNWGGSWGGRTCWNPSYVTAAWFELFSRFLTAKGWTTEAAKWANLRMFSVYEMAACDIQYRSKGLLPDFADAATGSESSFIQSQGYLNATNQGKSGQSDRGKSSFNFYYDAVRCPWRIAMDYSWNYPTTASMTRSQEQILLVEMTNFIMSKGGLSGIRDGYDVYGNAWYWGSADWNSQTASNTTGYAPGNPTHPTAQCQMYGTPAYVRDGGVGRSVTFSAMMPTAFMVGGTYALNAIQNLMTNKEDYNGNGGKGFHYYGNTLRLLSLFYMTGNMPDFSRCTFKSPPPNTGIMHVEASIPNYNGPPASQVVSATTPRTITLKIVNDSGEWINSGDTQHGTTLIMRYFFYAANAVAASALNISVVSDTSGGYAQVSPHPLIYDQQNNIYYVDICFYKGSQSGPIYAAFGPYGAGLITFTIQFSTTAPARVVMAPASEWSTQNLNSVPIRTPYVAVYYSQLSGYSGFSRIWGQEPKCDGTLPGKGVTSGPLKVLMYNVTKVSPYPSLSPYIRLTNASAGTVPLYPLNGSAYYLMYYFTDETYPNVGSRIVSARQVRPSGGGWDLLAMGLVGTGVYTPSNPSISANKVAMVSFGGAVTLNPGDYIDISLMITNSANGSFNQLNDYSFNSTDINPITYWIRSPAVYNSAYASTTAWGAVPW